jgi:hypothetical protein
MRKICSNNRDHLSAQPQVASSASYFSSPGLSSHNAWFKKGRSGSRPHQCTARGFDTDQATAVGLINRASDRKAASLAVDLLRNLGVALFHHHSLGVDLPYNYNCRLAVGLRCSLDNSHSNSHALARSFGHMARTTTRGLRHALCVGRKGNCLPTSCSQHALPGRRFAHTTRLPHYSGDSPGRLIRSNQIR